MMRKRTYIKRSSGKAIFSSKMFMTSKNQDKIRAAFQDDTNIELIQQLDEYIGDEYIALLKPEKQNAEKEKPKQTDEVKDEEIVNETPKTESPRRSGSPIKPSLREQYTDLEEDLDNDAEMTEGTPSRSSETSVSEESSEGEAVENATAIKSAVTVLPVSYEAAVTEIKGMLNANSDTTGVSRVQKKDDEIWIYYKDSVNLNNIMDKAIELLDSSSYTWMIFNRLARSENAMVFAILHDDTLKNIPSPPVTHKV